MAVRAQIDKVKFQEFTFEYSNSSTTYMMIQSAIEHLLVVTQCLFHASSTSEYAQLRPEAVIIHQFFATLAM